MSTARANDAVDALPEHIVLATRNEGKRAELEQILAAEFGRAVTVSTAAQLDLPEVAETGVTFAENALLKARSAARASGLPAVADDSGLAVDVLGGAPGIFSARWSGSHGDDAANLELLLAQLADVPDAHRGAEFVCAAAFVEPGGYKEPDGAWSAGRDGTRPDGPDGSRSGASASTEFVETGRFAGRLIREPRGENGFGYDPIFVPDGDERTAAQLSPEEKNSRSHRFLALSALARRLRSR